MDTTGTSTIQQQQEVDGLISQARIEYGKVCVSQHELGVTLLKLRDATKAQGSAGKGFEACLSQIGISKTQAYRFMRAAETGQPVDYDNDPLRPVNGTKLAELQDVPLRALIMMHLHPPAGVELTPVGLEIPEGLDVSFDEWLAFGKRVFNYQRESNGSDASMWMLGDVGNYGERKWGDKYVAALCGKSFALRREARGR
jgi:hypothetical protein